jgi:hypothetical protein
MWSSVVKVVILSYDTRDHPVYLDYLHDALTRHGCKLHAYVLMTNHVHLLVTPDSREDISLVMQSVNRLYGEIGVRLLFFCHSRGSGNLLPH